MSRPPSKTPLAPRWFAPLFSLTLLLSGIALSQPYTFTGRVLAGNPDLANPAPNITIQLIGDHDEWPENGPRTLLTQTTTRPDGTFTLQWSAETQRFPVYHLMLLTPPGTRPGGAETPPPGHVKNLITITYLETPPNHYPGTLFWILEQTGRPPEEPPDGTGPREEHVAELEIIEFNINPEPFIQNEPFALFILVLNAGTVPVEGVPVIVIADEERFVGEQIIDFLPPGEVAEIVIERVARLPGPHLLTAIIDPENTIPEHDKRNNRAHREVLVITPEREPPIVSPPQETPPQEPPPQAQLPPGVPCEGSPTVTCGDELTPTTAILGPVFMHALERYFLGLPAENELDQAIAAVMDANPEGQGLLRRALGSYRELPHEVKLELFDQEMLEHTATATVSLDLDLVRHRLATVDPGLVIGPFETPAAPSGLTAHNATTEDPEFRQYQIRLNWQDNAANEDGFAIYRAFSSGAGGTTGTQLLKTVGANINEYYDPLTAPAHQADQYCYQVRAFKTNPIGLVGQLPQPIESDPSNTACSYFDPSQQPPPADFDNDGVPDKDDDCPGTPGSVLGCPDVDKDGVADSFDPCPLEWGEDLIAFDNGPQPANGCPFKYKLGWMGMRVLNNSVPFTDQSGSYYYEGQDPFPSTGPYGTSYGEEEPFLLFNLVNGQSQYGPARSWTVRWCCGEHVDVAAGQDSEPDWDPVKKIDSDPSGNDPNQPWFNQLTSQGLPVPLFGEQGKPITIDRDTDLTMVVILMERDWTNQQCFDSPDTASEWQVAIKIGQAAGSAIGSCAGSFGLGCGLAIGKAIKSLVELVFSLDPDPVCVNVSDPDDYMGTDYWYVSRDSAQLLTSNNGTYGFQFDMPTTIIKVTTGAYSLVDMSPIYQTAVMRARLQFCLYREGVAENQLRTLCQPFNTIQVY